MADNTEFNIPADRGKALSLLDEIVHGGVATIGKSCVATAIAPVDQTIAACERQPVAGALYGIKFNAALPGVMLSPIKASDNLGQNLWVITGREFVECLHLTGKGGCSQSRYNGNR